MLCAEKGVKVRAFTPPSLWLLSVLFRLAAHPLAHIQFLAVGLTPSRRIVVLFTARFQALGAPTGVVAVAVPGSVNMLWCRPVHPPLPGGFPKLSVCRRASFAPAFVVNVCLRPYRGTGDVIHYSSPSSSPSALSSSTMRSSICLMRLVIRINSTWSSIRSIRTALMSSALLYFTMEYYRSGCCGHPQPTDRDTNQSGRGGNASRGDRSPTGSATRHPVIHSRRLCGRGHYRPGHTWPTTPEAACCRDRAYPQAVDPRRRRRKASLPPARGRS